jgi:2-oxoglutarate ferredoxin oxidoreductase subunit delta
MKLWRKPLDLDERAAPHCEIHLIENRCKGCSMCVEYCPRQVLKMSDKFNRRGYHVPTVDRPSECVGCRFCEEICPEFAIFCEDQS